MTAPRWTILINFALLWLDSPQPATDQKLSPLVTPEQGPDDGLLTGDDEPNDEDSAHEYPQGYAKPAEWAAMSLKKPVLTFDFLIYPLVTTRWRFTQRGPMLANDLG